MADQTVRFTKVQDSFAYDFTGARSAVKRYTFFIGTHGPFTEEVPLTVPFDEQEITRRVNKLKQHLALLPA
jgi:hypothetical protein